MNNLEEIIEDLKINTYRFSDNVFKTQVQSSSALTMKALIQITSKLDEQNIDYRIDHEYNIYILSK